MKCPTDGDTLLMTVRLGIEIDFCPTCRGLWLERGELSKLFEREASAYGGPATLPAEPGETAPLQDLPEPAPTPRGKRHDKDEDDDDDDDRSSSVPVTRRRRKDADRYDDSPWRERHRSETIVDSFLRELFDL
jgi:uncharacterized protein